MLYAPLPSAFIGGDASGTPPSLENWNALQNALGTGYATACIKTPERRGSSPFFIDFSSQESFTEKETQTLQTLFDTLMQDWRLAFETLLNRRWDLVDNPYAKVWILPGMLLIHEDPLNFPLDTHSDALREQTQYEETPTWILLRPEPLSGHTKIQNQATSTLPHADKLNAELQNAAREEGHEDLVTLEWKLILPDSQNLDIILTS